MTHAVVIYSLGKSVKLGANNTKKLMYALFFKVLIIQKINVCIVFQNTLSNDS